MDINVKIINQLSDNYSYIIYSKSQKKALIIDPSEAKSLINFLDQNNLSLEGVLITHHHSDHTSGIVEIKKKYNIEVYTPNNKINGTTKLVRDNDEINLNYINFKVISTPGHTLDHIVYFSKKEKLLFSGDALFYYGCGRVFEGTNVQMLNSLKKIKKLPDNTKVYCGHEYTYKNLEFILDELVYRKDKDALKSKCRKMIDEKGSSMPFYLDNQKIWNPYLNCDDIHWKQEISNFYKNKGKITPKKSELEFFTYVRNKRNAF